MMVPLSPTINAFSPLSSPASQFLAKEKPPLVSPPLRSSCPRSWSNEEGDTLPMVLTGGSPLQDVVIGARPDTSSLSPRTSSTLWTPTASLLGSTFHSKDFSGRQLEKFTVLHFAFVREVLQKFREKRAHQPVLISNADKTVLADSIQFKIHIHPSLLC